MAKYHCFDIEFATKYGIIESILYENIKHWVDKNKANENNYHDGYYWTYNSTKAFSKLFPYTSERTISRALKHLEDEKLIKSGLYNKSAYDRTKWYTILDTSNSNSYDTPFANLANGTTQDGGPIPNINSNKNLNNNINKNTSLSHENDALCEFQFQNKEAKQVLDLYLNKLYPKYTGNEPLRIKQNQYIKAYLSIETYMTECLLSYDDFISIMDCYFNNCKNTDFNINHFTNSSILSYYINKLELVEYTMLYDSEGNVLI